MKSSRLAAGGDPGFFLHHGGCVGKEVGEEDFYFRADCFERSMEGCVIGEHALNMD